MNHIYAYLERIDLALEIITLGLIVIWNIVVFCIYAADKKRSIRRKRRISERTLLILAFFAGAAGAFLAMILIRHKTKKTIFKILVPLFLILQIFLAVWGYFAWV